MEGIRGNREVPPAPANQALTAPTNPAVRASGPVEGVRGNREVPPGPTNQALTFSRETNLENVDGSPLAFSSW